MTSRSPRPARAILRGPGGAVLLCLALRAAIDPFAIAATTPNAAAVPDAAPVPLTVTVEPPGARVGDRIRVIVTAPEPATYTAAEAEGIEAGERRGGFRVLEAAFAPPRSFTLVLTPEETGAVQIESFSVAFRGPGGAVKGSVPARSLTVRSVLGEGDASLADLKPPVELSVPWPWARIGLAAVAAAGIGGAIAAWIRRRKRGRRAPVLPEEALPPGVTPDLWARAELDALLARNLVASGLVRQFHIELADLARRYLELRFRVPALERTTEEVVDEMQRVLLGVEAAHRVARFLERCDQVKFAKHVPDGDEVAQTVALARGLIDSTGLTITRPASADSAHGVVEARQEGTA